ncbi:UbiA family prenyltransferase [bacterium]|nr:UbiA family prenyltransferase [bacterium]
MRIKAGIHWFDYVFVLRPTLFLPVWTVFLAGFISAWTQGAGGSSMWADFLVSPAWVLLILITLLCGSSFILNQLKDVETDRANNKLFLLADGIISYRAAVVEAVSLLLLAIIGAFLLNFYQGFLFTFAFLITGWFYNFPPFEWKNHPIGGLVTNALVAAVIFCSGWFSIAEASWTALLHSGSYVAAVTAVFLLTTIPDEIGDRETGKITWVVRFGRRSTVFTALVFCLSAFVWAMFTRDVLMGIAAGISIPFFTVLSFSGTGRGLFAAIKMPILFLTVMVILKMPWYLGLIMLVLLSSRWYYRVRFNMVYPNFSKK